ncbi:MAG: hypothetical protein ACE5FN_07370 [Leptospirillia bacterium]
MIPACIHRAVLVVTVLSVTLLFFSVPASAQSDDRPFLPTLKIGVMTPTGGSGPYDDNLAAAFALAWQPDPDRTLFGEIEVGGTITQDQWRARWVGLFGTMGVFRAGYVRDYYKAMARNTHEDSLALGVYLGVAEVTWRVSAGPPGGNEAAFIGITIPLFPLAW